MGSTVYKAFIQFEHQDEPMPAPEGYKFLPPDEILFGGKENWTVYEMIEVRTNNRDKTITYLLGGLVRKKPAEEA